MSWLTFNIKKGGLTSLLQVRWILERDMWTPMARLTYLAYLVHPMILIPIYGGARVYHVYSEFELASKFAGNVSLAYVSLYLVLPPHLVSLFCGIDTALRLLCGC